MPRYIVKLKDYYLEYSTVVDAPVTYGMTLEQFKKYYHNTYGSYYYHYLRQRLERVDKVGTSCLWDNSAEETLLNNRAGHNEETLTVDEIYKAYCLREPIREGWIAD